MRSTFAYRSLVAALVMLTAPCAGARDGVIEINQVRALAGGVTPGDTAGFPVTLTRPGSYVLTGNLDLRALAGAQNIGAIEVEASGVSIDLGGFALLNANRCTGDPPTTPVSCTGGGSVGRGVGATGSDANGQPISGTHIRNGRIEGFGGAGVRCFLACTADNVESRHNAEEGFRVGEGSIVRNSVAELNFFSGVRGSRVHLLSSTVVRNGGPGANIASGSLVSQSVVARNAGLGLFVFVNVVDPSSPVGFQGSSFTQNNGGNANDQVSVSALPLGDNICGTDTSCP